ncbi:SPOR domain-containing protein [Derxia gummosa]|uniref:SPOR domain-containing protein n=1 Tax=Derxia gummosa DSM 723 TaxID=1121388 RepID=A0A8B6X4U5_9BURK|nr:SPOR domain-containing protein [Derxia gummosa]
MKRPPSAPPRSLRGGTFLGFILGLVTGLAVAVGVALFITKAPVPFVNRPNVKVGPDTPGAPPDPNKPFYGRDGGMPSATVAPPVAQSAPTQPAPTQPAPGQVAQPAAGQSAPQSSGQTPQAAAGQSAAARPAPAQPQGDRQFSFYDLMPGRKPGETPAAPTGAAAGQPQPAGSQPPGSTTGQTAARPAAGAAPTASAAPAAVPGAVAIPAPGTTAAPATAPETRYLLQAGAFRNEADADAMRARLALLGYDARVSPREGAGDPIYRVRIGPVLKLDDLNRMRQTLAQNGIDASVVRAP